MDPIVDVVLRYGPWPFAFIVVGYTVHWLTHDSHSPGTARDRWIGWLETDFAGARYRALLGAALDWIDRRLSPDADPTFPDKTDVSRAWSHGLLNFSLLCAVAYPFLALFLQWAWTGSPGRLGALIVLPAEESWLPRAVMICVVVVMVIGGHWAREALTVRQSLVAVGLLIGAAAAAAASGAAGGNAFALGFISSGAFARLRANAGVASASVSVSAAASMPGAGALALALPDAVALAAALLGAVAGAISVAGASVWLGHLTGRPTRSVAVCVAILTAALCAAVMLSPTLGLGIARDASLILFLGFLPLINAVADFASTGLTRHRLRLGLTGSPFREAAVDVVAGLAILMLLGFAMIAVIHWVRPQDGVAMADLPALFADLRADPGAYWWLYLMLFSTLVPTVLHLCVACLGFFTLYPPGLRRWIAAGLAAGERDPQHGRLASLALSLAITLAVVAPFFLLWQAATHAGRPVLSAMLDVFEGFARLIGSL